MTYQAMSNSSARSVARGLGWFSIALGAVEMLAPRRLSHELGMPGSEGVFRAYGIREIANGIGVLSSDEPGPWIWGRVGGDILDIATLATGLTRTNPRRENLALAIAAVVGVTALDVACAQALSVDRKPRFVSDYSARSGFPRGPQAMRGIAADQAKAMAARNPTGQTPLRVQTPIRASGGAL